MKQKRITSIDGLLAQTSESISGATKVGAGLLLRNTAEAIGADRSGLIAAQENCVSGEAELARRRKIFRQKVDRAREFAVTTRDLLKRRLGSRSSAAWIAVGFKAGTIQLPRTDGEMMVLVEKMQLYLAANPTVQVLELDITVQYAGTLLTELIAARSAVNFQTGKVTELWHGLDEARRKLSKRQADLILELRQVLDPLDGRWQTFGLNRPGVKQTPAVPENVTAELVTETNAAVKWPPAPRAEHYRAWKRVIGVEKEFEAAGSPVDCDFTLEALPRNSEIEIAVSAVNNGGESSRSAPIIVVTK
jgi:hypothetical protein